MNKTPNKISKTSGRKNDLPGWNLSDLYQGIDDKQIDKDLETYRKTAMQFAKKYKGKVAELDAAGFLKMARECEKRSVLGSKLGIFSYLTMVTQMKNAAAMTFYQNISEKLNDYSKPTIFLSLELNRLPETKIKEWLKDKKAAYYKPWLMRVRLFKDYELSEEVEEILHEKSVTSGEGWERLYEETSARLKYTVDGKEYNDAEIAKLTLEKSAKTRAKAGREIARVCTENAPLFTLNYNMVVKDKAIEDIKRGFKTPVASQNLANRVDDKAVTALADTVRANYADLAHRFYKLKAKWLKVKKLEYWDRNAPLPFESDRQYSWDEAVEIVLTAYKTFSPKLYDLAKDFFDKEHSWIDVPPRDGKRSGAFAMPLPEKYHPYFSFTSAADYILRLLDMKRAEMYKDIQSLSYLGLQIHTDYLQNTITLRLPSEGKPYVFYASTLENSVILASFIKMLSLMKIKTEMDVTIVLKMLPEDNLIRINRNRLLQKLYWCAKPFLPQQ